MKTIVVVLMAVLAAPGWAQERRMGELSKEKLLRLQAEKTLLEERFQAAILPVTSQMEKLIQEECKPLNIKLEECRMDLATGRVFRQAPPAPTGPAKQEAKK